MEPNMNDFVGKSFTWDCPFGCNCENEEYNYVSFDWDEGKRGWWERFHCGCCSYVSEKSFISAED